MSLRAFVIAAGLGLAGVLSVATAQAGQPLKVGVSAGPYGDILRFASDLAAKEGIEVKVVEFTDYTLPNAALAQGDIDFNNFQHLPYLENQVKTRGYDIVPLERSIIVPMGIYSKKVSSLAGLATGATVAIPNDPTNGARALQLLERHGLLTLRPEAGLKGTPADILANPRRLKIKELDAAQLPRSLDDVDIAVVTLNYALGAGLEPKSALALESNDTQWGLVFAALKARKDDPLIRRFVAIYRSPEVKSFIEAKFNGTILPTW
jgi:D-methionine transport system substrate-binding protein